MTWTSIFIAGILTYFTRMSIPSIIFPGVLLDDFGAFVTISDPKIFGAITALVIGFFTRNVILTIVSGLTSYWAVIFVF